MYRGGAEQKIRKYLVDNNYIDCNYPAAVLTCSSTSPVLPRGYHAAEKEQDGQCRAVR
ncbi:MAG: hypothetical protein ACLVJH_00530 [Faecalibacterium prausnitzii]